MRICGLTIIASDSIYAVGLSLEFLQNVSES